MTGVPSAYSCGLIVRPLAAGMDLRGDLGHPAQGCAHGDAGGNDQDHRGAGRERRECDVMFVGSERDDDERHLESFQQDALEADREAVAVDTSWLTARRPRRCKLCGEDCILVVQCLEPACAQDRLAQPLQPKDKQQPAHDKAQNIDRQHGERRAQYGDGCRQHDHGDAHPRKR